MKIAIIGWTGLVGQTLTSCFKADLYNSSNILEIVNKKYDIIYMCGMPADKWRINMNPQMDYNNTTKLIDILKTVSAMRFILISTVDIFDCTISQNESGTFFASHYYGKHRRMMEKFVIETFKTYNILRLPGLFGIGLKKNIIYDLIFDNQIDNICPESEFQWYNVENINKDIQICIDNNINILNLVSKPILVRKIIEKFFPEKIGLANSKNQVKYDLITEKKPLGYWSTNEEIMLELETYINFEKKNKNIPIQIAISNIAWNNKDFKDILKILDRFRINGIELAPSKIVDWSLWNNEVIKDLKSYNIRFISCQSILFNTSFNIFTDKIKFIEHYLKILKICQNLGIQNIIFGSPKARHLGKTNISDVIKLFRDLGDLSKKYDIILSIEPNSSLYGCTWLTNISNTLEFIKLVNHPNIKLNYDLGNYIMEKDTFIFDNNTIQYINHIQISNIFLKPLSELSNLMIDLYIIKLKEIFLLGYSKAISLEMIESSMYDLEKSIQIFINIIHSSYYSIIKTNI